MKIQLLGTGAADGIPSLFADSEVSRYALEHGGKDVRTRSSALVDGVLKIDFPPDIHQQLIANKLRMLDWSAIFFTHSHDDHLARNELQYALYPFTECECMPLTLFGNDAVCTKLRERYPCWPLEIIQTCSFEPVEHLHYTVTPIKANHKLDEDSQNLIIQDGSKTLLYGTDTGWWMDETWDYLGNFRLDALIIECTEGFHSTAYYGHLDIDECIKVVAKLRQMGVVRDQTQVVTTHHAHSGGATHAQLEAALEPHGITPGFDGMMIEI